MNLQNCNKCEDSNIHILKQKAEDLKRETYAPSRNQIELPIWNHLYEMAPLGSVFLPKYSGETLYK